MQLIETLGDIADRFDAIVLDQWGVLHDGSAPYPLAVQTLRKLRDGGTRLSVLSNSGKRSAPNAARITAMGFDGDLFETVMTSGEALWQDIARGEVPYNSLYPITRAAGDAENWAEGLDISLAASIEDADAVLLMGLPDGARETDFDAVLETAMARGLPMLCTNPDRASPRADGVTVVSPGALAHTYKNVGGDVRFYGKPHAPVFNAIATTLGTTNLLMIGDSLEHDISGGQGAGWSTLFIQGGLHAAAFDGRDVAAAITNLAREDASPLPTYSLPTLR